MVYPALIFLWPLHDAFHDAFHDLTFTSTSLVPTSTTPSSSAYSSSTQLILNASPRPPHLVLSATNGQTSSFGVGGGHVGLRGQQLMSTTIQTHMDPFSQLAAIVPSFRRLVYSSPSAMGRYLLQLYESNAKELRILFEDVPPECLDILDQKLKHLAIRRHVRFTYEEEISSLIVRLMPSLGHEVVCSQFFIELICRITSLPGHSSQSICGLNSTRFTVPGIRSKEADAALGPSSRTLDPLPQVGYAEGLSARRIDAKWWLLNSGGQTKLVLIFNLKRDPFALRIERWEMTPYTGRQTRQGRTSVPASTQIFDISQDGHVVPSSTPLTLPYLSIFDAPHVAGQDIVFTPRVCNTRTGVHVRYVLAARNAEELKEVVTWCAISAEKVVIIEDFNAHP
ncbi:hypothetical protein DFH27DRAFT_609884 [Peziza echinospora]|nr:hypothetical protein DFH27DRAFT_609884 [Peziza echinospora]